MTKHETMRAVVIEGPGEPDVLQVRAVPRPSARPGWVLMRVEAFGLNRSELHFRRGVASTGSFPRIPGIEATGVVIEAPAGEFAPGTQAMTLMGGMGRSYDGGYAQYVLVPASTVIPFRSELDWATLGAVPEMLQTAYGSLVIGLDARDGDTILIRGGTSSVGLAIAVLAKLRGMTVMSTTRSPDRSGILHDVGVDHVLIDDGDVASQVRAILPDGVSGAVELVGAPTVKDTLRATAVHGTVCFTGMLSDQWTLPDFYPLDYLPNGVRLTAYSGEARDLPAPALQEFLDALASGKARIPIARVYTLDEIVEAHRDMEEGIGSGKRVVLTR